MDCVVDCVGDIVYRRQELAEATIVYRPRTSCDQKQLCFQLEHGTH